MCDIQHDKTKLDYVYFVTLYVKLLIKGFNKRPNVNGTAFKMLKQNGQHHIAIKNIYTTSQASI